MLRQINIVEHSPEDSFLFEEQVELGFMRALIGRIHVFLSQINSLTKQGISPASSRTYIWTVSSPE